MAGFYLMLPVLRDDIILTYKTPALKPVEWLSGSVKIQLAQCIFWKNLLWITSTAHFFRCNLNTKSCRLFTSGTKNTEHSVSGRVERRRDVRVQRGRGQRATPVRHLLASWMDQWTGGWVTWMLERHTNAKLSKRNTKQPQIRPKTQRDSKWLQRCKKQPQNDNQERLNNHKETQDDCKETKDDYK